MGEQLIATPATFGENGNYILERELGHGGMGGVYLGRDKMLDRPVAVKVMLKEYGSDPAFVEKFKSEAQAAAKLLHPNIAQIYSFGVADGMPYIVMELVAGGSLDGLMEQSRLSSTPTDVTRVMKIGEQIAQALRCAADHGFVHGDIKPENILLDANGNAKIVDFGLAGMQHDTDEIWGTPYYIAPEKVQKESVDFRADMYSLGATLYHALTGVAPFEGDDTVAVVRKRFEGAPKKPSEVRPGLSPKLDDLILKMIALKKEDRFPSFEALIESFKDVLTTGLATASVPAAAAPAKKAAGGKKRLVMRKRGMTIKKKTSEDDADFPESGEGEEDEENPKKRKLKRKYRSEEDDEDEEEGGGVAGKVLLSVFGGIALIAALAGGLWWYVQHDKEVRASEKKAQYEAGIGKAREAIAATRAAAERFGAEFISFAENATHAVEQSTEELAKLLPDYADEMKPPMTKELVDAIASTNFVEKAMLAEAASNAVLQAAAEAAAGTNGTATAKAAKRKRAKSVDEEAEEEMEADAKEAAKGSGKAPKKAQAKVADTSNYGYPPVSEGGPKIPPRPEDFDEESPEGQDWIAAKDKAVAEWEAKKGKKAKKGEAAEEAEAEKSAEEEKPAVAKKPPPPVVNDIRGLWEKAYACQACVIRIGVGVSNVVALCDSANEVKGDDTAVAAALSELSMKAKEALEALRGSKDVETVRKGITFIKQKGEKSINQTRERLRVEKLQAERAAKKAAEAEAEKKRLEERQAAHAKLVADEQAAAKALFAKLAEERLFHVLDWERALRRLTDAKKDCKSAEGQLAIDAEIQKVNMMKAVQEVLVENMKGYKFKRGTLRNCLVTRVDAKEIHMTKPDGKTPYALTWKKLYEEQHGALNELLLKYVDGGRNVSKYKGATLSLKPWADAMMGSAMTIRIVCSDDASGAKRSEQIARAAVAKFPEYQKRAEAIFPDIDFNATEEDAEEKKPKAGKK